MSKMQESDHVLTNLIHGPSDQVALRVSSHQDIIVVQLVCQIRHMTKKMRGKNKSWITCKYTPRVSSSRRRSQRSVLLWGSGCTSV